MAEAIKDISGGGVGHVLDTTDRGEMLDHAVTALRPLGRVGLVAGGAPDNTVPAAKLAFGKTVSGIVQGDAVPQVFIPRLAGFHRSGRFPVERLVRLYDFDDIETAFAAAASGEAIKPVPRMPDSGAHSRG